MRSDGVRSRVEFQFVRDGGGHRHLQHVAAHPSTCLGNQTNTHSKVEGKNTNTEYREARSSFVRADSILGDLVLQL